MSLSEVAKSISSKAVWQQCYGDKCLSHSWEEGTIGSSWGVGRSVCMVEAGGTWGWPVCPPVGSGLSGQSA